MVVSNGDDEWEPIPRVSSSSKTDGGRAGRGVVTSAGGEPGGAVGEGETNRTSTGVCGAGREPVHERPSEYRLPAGEGWGSDILILKT